MILGSIGASVHPMVTVTQPGTALVGAATAVVGAGASGERTSNPSSSPSHSQISRNSSRKSNNSILVVNGKIEGFSFFFNSTFILILYAIQSGPTGMEPLQSLTFFQLPDFFQSLAPWIFTQISIQWFVPFEPVMKANHFDHNV